MVTVSLSSELECRLGISAHNVRKDIVFWEGLAVAAVGTMSAVLRNRSGSLVSSGKKACPGWAFGRLGSAILQHSILAVRV